MYKHPNIAILASCAALLCFTSCLKFESDDMPSPGFKSENGGGNKEKMEFDITVTRDGEVIPQRRIATKGGYDVDDRYATMDTDRPIGVIGMDFYTHELLIDNEQVFRNGENYSGWFNTESWKGREKVAMSAYYPFVEGVGYEDDNSAYSIPFKGSDVDAGPLVSKTVEQAMDRINLIPFEFQHITNDIGYTLRDVTADPQLQNLIHVRKVTATNVASAGVFINNMHANNGLWGRQSYYRDVVVFEGDAKLSTDEQFVGKDALVDKFSDSSRYYAVPDEILIGKQCIIINYDVEAFTLGGYTYEALPGQVSKFMLYNVIPGNVMEYGRQYTFHLGLDTGELYHAIQFSASVADWESHIYEDNEVF